MAISYNVYANDGNGGEVNYREPIATTPDLSYVVPQLAAPSDNLFAVRAFDAVSGVEEANTDARVRIIIDASGRNVTARPNAVIGLSVRPTVGGTCWVSWGYHSTGQGGPPSLFNVSMTAGSTPLLAKNSTSVAYLPSVTGYGCTLTGLDEGESYSIAVQAIGASSELAGTVAMVQTAYLATSLSGVDSLVAMPMA